ncbi:MAG: transcription-repair coupling factor [Oscillospiraceae bacterium]|nr:transcription-repair coupling factor [Oscillospiraceae bacterium]
MELLLRAVRAMPEYRTLSAQLKKGNAVGVSGAAQLCRTHLIASLLQETEGAALLVCQDEIAATRLQGELKAFLGEEFPILPQRELSLYDASAVSRGWDHQRLRLLHALACGKLPRLIAPIGALCQRTIPPENLRSAAIRLKTGAFCQISALLERLTACGYRRTSLVEGAGQFALRGGILDVYSPAEDLPVRVEFFGDEIDCMGFFDPATQRRTENLDEILLLPAAETQPGLHQGGKDGLIADLDALLARQKRRKHPHEKLIETITADKERLEADLPLPAADRYMALIYPEFACAADYLPQGAAVMLCDHGNLSRASKASQDDLGLELDSCLQSGLLAGELCDYTRSFDELCEAFAEKPTVYFDAFLASKYPEARPPKELLSFTCKQLPSYGGSLDTAADDARHYQTTGYATLVLCGGRRRAEILQEALSARGVNAVIAQTLTELPEPGQVVLTDGSLPAGLEYPTLRLAILTEGQLMAEAQPRRGRRAKAKPAGQKLQSFTDLHPGDYVVHEHYGIGRYTGIEQIKSDGVIKDYIRIAYQGTDVLFIPATQLGAITKYVGGGEEGGVRLNKLGGDGWQKTKARAKSAAKELAAGLIQLYAQRKRLPGFAFSADTPWQQEFEDAFPYAETDDQIRAIAEIKRDMESPAPMDRLLCGDVGFGKTEVALRAIMKAILDGKQAAILVPTTVLAQQHYATTINRFRGYPVEIAVLSRFQTPKQVKQTLSGLESGKIDLVIGTHKLLQKTVKFKNLGLLVVDEEQRFGVTHKERLKEMSVGVDVLTLSATPIPRTLNMALSGLRDMSTIEQPPQDRYPVQTFVLEHADPILDDAMRRELERGGQVYYLHNRTETIEETAAAIKKRLGGVEVGVAHGKMSEEELSDVMQRMVDGEIKILVCTTIIETGIDIPNVNTLIIEDADRLGLAQLHQLRGRVGRSSRRAFAYLTFRRGKVLTEVAEKRLEAIREYAEFGSGFKIAMRDLEIRGAGDLLGAEQSGHILSVGYEMYLKLLEDAVLEEKGEERPKEPDCTADLTVTANIAQDYVPAPEQRMDLYRRMALVRTQADADELLDEIVDRFGDPPKGVLNLIDIALLRAEASRAQISEIRQRDGCLWLTPYIMDFAAISAVCNQKGLRGKLSFSAGKTPMLCAKLADGEDPLKLAQTVVRAYASAQGNKE